MKTTTTSEYPGELIDELRTGNVIPFIGSGFSLPSGVPSWRELVEGLFDELNQNGFDIDGLRESFKKGDITSIDAPELHAVLAGKYSLRQYVKHCIDKPWQPNEYHELLAELPFDILITTNWDNLIEKQYDNIGIAVHTISRDDHLSYFNAKQRVTLVKAHGTIGDVDNIVISADEYRQYKESHEPLYSFLRTVFITQRVLFLGFSVADPNIRSLITAMKNNLTMLRHYALLCDASNSDVEVLRHLGVKTIHIEAEGNQTRATIAWLRGLVERSHIFGRGNKEKATMVNVALREEIKGGLPSTIIRVRAALGPLSNPPAYDANNLLYGSLEQDTLEVDMGNLTRQFLGANNEREFRCILHINPQHQRSKGYTWYQLKRRFEAMRDFVNTFPNQIHIAHSPIPVDMNQFIMGRGKSFVCFKRGEAMGFEHLIMNSNRWVVDADIKSFDNDFTGIQMLNKKLAENLGIDTSGVGWPATLTLRLLDLALKATQTTKHVIQCDETGKDLGTVSRDSAHAKGILHKSVHLHLIDSSSGQRRVLVQRRPKITDLYGGMLDVTVSGHPETPDMVTEMLREVREELGLDLRAEDIKSFGHRRRENGTDVEWVEIFYADASRFVSAIEACFTTAVDAIYWITWPVTKKEEIDAKGVLRFGSLLAPTQSVIRTDEFVPGVIEEIDAVLTSIVNDAFKA